MQLTFGIGKWRCWHIGEHTVPNTYDVRLAVQIRLFELQPSENPIFVLSRSVKSKFMHVLV